MAVTCLSRLPLRACIEIPGISLARARGIEVPRDTIDRMLAVGATLDPSWKTSMLTDLEAGKVIEAESIFGV